MPKKKKDKRLPGIGNKIVKKPIKPKMANKKSSKSSIKGKELTVKSKNVNLEQTFAFILRNHHYFTVKVTPYRMQGPGDDMQMSAKVIAQSDDFISLSFNNENGQASDPFSPTIIKSNQNNSGHDITILVIGEYKPRSKAGKPWLPLNGKVTGTNDHFIYEFGSAYIFVEIEIY